VPENTRGIAGIAHVDANVRGQVDGNVVVPRLARQ